MTLTVLTGLLNSKPSKTFVEFEMYVLSITADWLPFFIPPSLKKLRGYTAFALFVCLFIHYSFHHTLPCIQDFPDRFLIKLYRPLIFGRFYIGATE